MNSLVHRDRRLGNVATDWVAQFNCSRIAPLIICRGPIRFEAMNVFTEMGINHYGILVSNKDSIVYPNALAPELRAFKNQHRIHPIADYSGNNADERRQRIEEIITIATTNGYNAIFAGYGFMAEDENMVAAVERVGLTFIGPCSMTVRKAGLKDEAKRTAEASNVSVTPGINQATNLANVKRQVENLMLQYPDYRIRLKATNGGGGKGQRILDNAEDAEMLSREILSEMKCSDDDNVILIELNIETTRHQEIQVIGNGDWCITLGGRDCSLQMHEQKLLEVSVTVEELQQAIQSAQQQGNTIEADILKTDLDILKKMESEAVRFGKATGLDSVSTFECIVDGKNHFFMEMNTRIQVEHRVSELCYKLIFSNPDAAQEQFEVESLVELMVLLAAHGKRLPKPKRILREGSAVEARLNATNHALQPHAGGTIEYWSKALDTEIRDDQGICTSNPDTDAFIKYYLAGAYDSNIALLLTTGNNRLECYQQMAEVLRQSTIRGKDLATNLAFQYGLVNWFIGNNINARPTTAFIQPYLTLVGQLYQLAQNIDLKLLHHNIETPDGNAHNLILRPLQKLFSNPHHLMGWINLQRLNYSIENPSLTVNHLADLYHYLNMDYRKNRPAANMIWKEDYELLQTLDTAKNIRTLEVLPWLAKQAECYSITVCNNLTIDIPDKFKDKSYQQAMSLVLAPPPQTNANQILAVSGGMYYSKPSPDMKAFVEVGSHFNQGDSLYIVEVMKMFNTVKAPFAGTVDKVSIDTDGCIIKKGQVILEVTPDEPIVLNDDEQIALQRKQFTHEFLNQLI